jgi:Zn-dependent M28 family amino/carboxypeptidase
MKRIALVLALLGLLIAGAVWFAITQPLFDRAAAKPVPAPAQLSEALRRHVQKLSVDFFPRDHTNIKNLDAAAEYIRGELHTAKATVTMQPFRVNGFNYRNVIGVFEGSASTANSPTIVIGAHYDAFEKLPGTDDNASGVAGLIELAKMLSEAPLKHRVELVAYTLEEPPHFRSERMGSHVHATHLAKRSTPIKLMISLECIGYFSDEPNTQDFPVPGLGLIYPTTGNFIAVVGRYADRAHARTVKRAMRNAASLPVHSISAPSFVQGIDFSDQLNYWAQGYSALMVTDTAFFRNKAYHTAEDTADRLDYRRMAEVVLGVHAAVRAIDAEDTQAP